MHVYTVEKENKTIGVFMSTKELLTFLYLHEDEFGFHDDGENLVTSLAGADAIGKLNDRLSQKFRIKGWTSGTDTYTKDEGEYGKDVDIIAADRPKKSWNVTMQDNTKMTVVAAFMPTAVAQAQADYILDNGSYSAVKEIKEI